VWTIVVLVTGGFSLALGPLRLSSHRALPPLLGGVLAYSASHLWGPSSDEVWSALRALLIRLSPALAALLAALVIAVGTARGSRVAAGADCYGYVSQAELWVKGQLIQTDPLAYTLARRFSPRVFAPLGYQVGPSRGSIVPLYPPGLPLLMAAAGLAFGPAAMFLVVPACGGLLVLLTFALGRLVGGPLTGLVSAGLLAAHPSFLLQLIQPMSDVPAAAAWTAALALALWGGATWPALGSGLAVSLAVLVRPNLAPLALAVALLVLARPGPLRLRRLGAFAIGVVPGAVALALINRTLYGSPFLSGYGDVRGYFDVAHVAHNLVFYPRWLFETQGPFVFLALLAPVALRRRAASDEHGPQLPLATFAALGAVLLGIYALYLPFDDWTYVRFMLPGLPLALALAAASARASLRRLGAALRVPLLVALVGVSCAWGLRYTRELNILDLAEVEQRYVTLARYVARSLPERAAIICVLHSGSLRYYAHRETLRFDWLDGNRLEPLLHRLERRGYQPYFVLEDWEEPLFRKRFAASTPFGALDWPPLARMESPGVVSVYDPRDRARSLGGQALVTARIE
jgi:hypothetical protein